MQLIAQIPTGCRRPHFLRAAVGKTTFEDVAIGSPTRSNLLSYSSATHLLTDRGGGNEKRATVTRDRRPNVKGCPQDDGRYRLTAALALCVRFISKDGGGKQGETEVMKVICEV